MKIDRIYSKIQRNGKYYIIARIKRKGEFTIEQIEISAEQYRTVKAGDALIGRRTKEAQKATMVHMGIP